MATAIPEASGATVRPHMLERQNYLRITDFGASESAVPVENTRAVNKAIETAAQAGGGTVVFPAGTYRVYTILLRSNVNLLLEEGAVVAAAKADNCELYGENGGEGGNYCEPEVNPCLGIQDHGHSYFANSLVYGADLENIMISGKGLFTGGRFDGESGIMEYVLQGGDPPEPDSRGKRGHKGAWFGNKGLAFVRCRNLVFRDFSVTIGGHFAVITTGCENLWVDGILLDTTRDAFDIDCCQNVTIRNTVCNSLTDDGLCLKASFGAGIFKPLSNVLIEDCAVSGYDAGSVYAGEYTRDKLVAADRCGPTGRVKFGTEATCGYHLVTIRRVKFDRSRGFCMEAVDCSSLTDVIFEDCTMDNVSSSPVFIRAGDRGRFPVTGSGSSLEYPLSSGDVRLDNMGWVLPNAPGFHPYPARRYAPSYNRTKTVTVDGHSFFEVLDEKNPVRCNPANYEEVDGRFYLKVWKEKKDGESIAGSYETDMTREIPKEELPLYANAVGSGQLARVENVLIRNVHVTNADPRYPVLLMGMTDSHLKNIVLEDIFIEYRGGLTMEHAVEQRQLNTEWKYSQFHEKDRVQNIPWLVNTFFLKHEGLLPRADWDASGNCWRDDPYNVPELPEVYPESSNWGILPAYGIFAKHVDGLTLRNLKMDCKVPDGRHVCVLDDVNGVSVDGLEAFCAEGISPIAAVAHHYRRHTNAENVPGQPYFSTEVKGLEILQPPVLHSEAGGSFGMDSREKAAGVPCVADITIDAPAPGTPRDRFYGYPTVPCAETGYFYKTDTPFYAMPLTVHRPFIRPLAPVKLSLGTPFCVALTVRCPASDISEIPDDGVVYGEVAARLPYSVSGAAVKLSLYCENLPSGAAFDPESGMFSWTPEPGQTGSYEIIFVADDGVIPEKVSLFVTVE